MTAAETRAPIETDAVVVGAGPVGLFQVFQLGLLEISAHVIDVLPHPGGQCAELYPDKPIYDIPGIPVCTGQELTHKLLQQIAPFGATFHYGQELCALARQTDGRLLLGTNQGQQFLTKTLFIASGMGAFKPKIPAVEGLERLKGHQLSYATPSPEVTAGKQLLIVGGDDAALDAAIGYCALPDRQRPSSITLLHRRDVLAAEPEKLARITALCASGSMQFVAGQIHAIRVAQGMLSHVQILGTDGLIGEHPVDHMLVLLGLSPKLGPIAHWGLAMERRQLQVDTASFVTSEPGIFAVGDINTYPGKKKLILCGFHEATLAAYAAAAHVFPDKRIQVQYTTTSPRLRQLLSGHSDPGRAPVAET